jgi:hypothetical protein
MLWRDENRGPPVWAGRWLLSSRNYRFRCLCVVRIILSAFIPQKAMDTQDAGLDNETKHSQEKIKRQR